MLIETLLLGFALGMRHALDADHVAAVATLAGSGGSRRDALRLGTLWGIGHALTLLLACAAVLLQASLPPRLGHYLECLVGVVLIVLGVDLLLRLRRERIHVHTHRHADGTMHVHAHSHAGEHGARRADHEHAHPRSLGRRALGVGALHGLAGTAALLLLSAGALATPLTSLLYVGTFALGSVAGMACLSLAIGIPLQGLRRWTRASEAARGALALASVLIGGRYVLQALP